MGDGIDVTGTDQKAAWVAGVLPPVEKVRPGLWSVPVPIPNNPLRYVLVYVFELADGLAIVDAGWPTPDAWSALEVGIVETGHAVTDIRAVVVTHVHPDHHGLAGRVREVSGAWIGMHALEARTLSARPADAQRIVDQSRTWLTARGAPERAAVKLSGTAELLAPFLSMAQPDRLIEDGERVFEPADAPDFDLHAVWTPGHTPGHLCFHERRGGLFLSGDHVLPRISPNISVQPDQAPDPLTEFLESLEKVGGLDANGAVEEVLPAHEYRFRGLARRTAAMRDHHEQRLRELAALIAGRPHATTWDLAAALTWSRPWEDIHGFHKRSAISETAAHLVVLVNRGLARNAGAEVDDWVAFSKLG